MSAEWALSVWSGAGIAWWLISWWLVADGARARERIVPAASETGTLSIFKPLPPLGTSGLDGIEAGLESFAVQLDDESELLLGVHEADRAAVTPWLERLRRRHPRAQLKVIFRDEPDGMANPKIDWQKRLAPHAEGDLWFWSDADIVAPPGLLRAMRDEFSHSGARLLTFPYVIRELPSRPALLDALYVNAEFYPGVLLLRRFGPVDFGLGAGMLFRRSDFLRRLDWKELGAALADDFMIGQKLQPVQLSETTLATAAGVATWKDALLHYLRWNKTVWWNRPGGSAARIVILPVAGWLAYLALHPARLTAWLGLVAMTQADVFFSALLCRSVGCRWGVRDLLGTEAWSLGRVAVWLACWLPWPVVWSGRIWWRPRWGR